MRSRLVVIVCFPGVQPLDVVGPHEVFAGATRLLASSHKPGGYQVELVASTPGPVTAESGLVLVASHPLPRARSIDTLLVPGGDGVFDARADQRLVSFVRRAARTTRRVGSVCSGTFLLAEAGLLDGRTVTTHWRRAGQLADEYPELRVDADPIYIHDDTIWTSAGVTAGIDLALAMVEQDHGPDLAQTIARHLVMFLRRPGGQSQFAAPVWTAPAAHDGVRAAQDHVNVDPAGDHRVDTLARAAGMSGRHFTRVFHEQVGESPARYVERVRVERARAMLERDECGVAVVAQRCGFGTAETMRRAFVRRIGVAPDDYRKRFR
jgi:transcriptional regulator GlxA family with amidase domain